MERSVLRCCYLFVMALLLSSCSETRRPVLANLTIEVIAGDVSVVKCSVLDGGSGVILEKGFELINERDVGNDDAIKKIIVEDTGGSFSSEIHGLVTDDVYYVRAYATNDAGTGHSDSQKFMAKASFYAGSLFLSSAEDVADFIMKGYERIDGDLVIGSSVTAAPESYVCYEDIADTRYYFTENNDIHIFDGLDLKQVDGDIYIIGLQNVSSLSWISALSNSEKITVRYNKQLSEWPDLSSFQNLKELVVDNNKLTTVDISGNANLSLVNCSGNLLSDLDISNLPLLKNLCCHANRIDSVNIRYNRQLTDLQCGLQKDDSGAQVDMILSVMESQKINRWDKGWFADSLNEGVIVDGVSETGLPVISTLPVVEISSTSIVARGRISDVGSTPTSARGWLVATSKNMDWDNNEIRKFCGYGLGEYSLFLNGLNPGTVYYIKAFAQNQTGTAYGEEYCFATLAQ